MLWKAKDEGFSNLFFFFFLYILGTWVYSFKSYSGGFEHLRDGDCGRWLSVAWESRYFHWAHFCPKLSCSCSVAKSCLTLCDPMDCSMPGFPVLHCLSEFAQTPVYWVGDTMWPSCPLSFPFSSHLQSFPASGSFPMSWLFASGGLSIGASASASVLPVNNQGWFPLGLTGFISLQSKGLSRVFSNTTIQKHQFCSAFCV